MNEVAETLKIYNLSEDELADILQVSRSCINKWKNGRLGIPFTAVFVMRYIRKYGIKAIDRVMDNPERKQVIKWV